jgi:HTH-type transcriptional regulator/antitoxin MqsA
MNTKNTCPLCEEGLLHEHSELMEAKYKDRTEMRYTYFSVCTECGAEQASAKQVLKNKRDMIAFKKEVEGLLTGAQVRTLRERIGITQAQAAQVFGGGPVAFSKYESDDVMQSEAMDKLLRVAEAVPNAYAKLALDAGITLPATQQQSSPKWQDTFRQDQKSVTPAKHPQLRVIRAINVDPEPKQKYA